MFDISSILNVPPYSLSQDEKDNLFIDALTQLSQWHYSRCVEYKKIIDFFGLDLAGIGKLQDVPFLPVRLFKEFELVSTDRSSVVKTMTSSGTTGQKVSKIFLDRETSANQTKALVKIVSSFTGRKRLPILIIDTRAVLKDRAMFSARGAGILGFSMLGYDVTYALDERMNLDLPGIIAFLERHKDEEILIFGFTFMIWQHFYSALAEAGTSLKIPKGIMVHGGGWKKLSGLSIDNASFKNAIFEIAGIRRVHNYYGMVEQTGSIFMECEEGFLHSSVFSDVLIRDHTNFNALGVGEEGLVQLLSLLPVSYPGHSILSEDVGSLAGIDDCACGRKGKYFLIAGRVQNAEIRGCSDTYTAV